MVVAPLGLGWILYCTCHKASPHGSLEWMLDKQVFIFGILAGQICEQKKNE